MSETLHRQGPWKWYWRVEDGAQVNELFKRLKEIQRAATSA